MCIRDSSRTLDAAADQLTSILDRGAVGEGEARWVAERMALVLQGALLVRHAPAVVAEAFVGSRLSEDRSAFYGAFARAPDIAAIVARQLPA